MKIATNDKITFSAFISDYLVYFAGCSTHKTVEVMIR
jgi:hypothetical protein